MLTLASTAQEPTVQTSEDSYPRWQFYTNIGFVKMTGLPKGIDEQISTAPQILLNANIHLAKRRHYLSVGLGYEGSRYVADGMFTKSGDQYNFQLTPANIKQNEIQMHYLHFPVLYRGVYGKRASTAFGPYAGYLLNAEHQFKTGTDKQESDAHVENKFRMGLVLDAEFILGGSRSLKPVLGYGLQYQLTRHLKDQRSFKPLVGYIKIGFAL